MCVKQIKMLIKLHLIVDVLQIPVLCCYTIYTALRNKNYTIGITALTSRYLRCILTIKIPLYTSTHLQKLLTLTHSVPQHPGACSLTLYGLQLHCGVVVILKCFINGTTYKIIVEYLWGMFRNIYAQIKWAMTFRMTCSFTNICKDRLNG